MVNKNINIYKLMYSRIFNPLSQKMVNLNSKIGKNILKKYLFFLLKGGSGKNPQSSKFTPIRAEPRAASAPVSDQNVRDYKQEYINMLENVAPTVMYKTKDKCKKECDKKCEAESEKKTKEKCKKECDKKCEAESERKNKFIIEMIKSVKERHNSEDKVSVSEKKTRKRAMSDIIRPVNLEENLDLNKINNDDHDETDDDDDDDPDTIDADGFLRNHIKGNNKNET